MATINVNRSVADPFYRYKMPRLQAKVEGRGNGIKTVIANMQEIAKALERPPEYPTKYFGCELGAQTKVDQKNERYIVNGEHDAAKLQDILDGFIRKFVLCPACDNPETTLQVRKDKINSKCKACGHSFVIDNKHRVATFILKNPPKIDVDFEKAKEKANGGATAKAEAEDDGIAAAADKNNSSEDADDDDDDWAPEPIDAELLTGGVGKLTINADLDKSVDERLDMLHQFFVRKRDAGALDGKALLDEAERLELKQKAPLLLVEVLLTEDILKKDELATYRKVFLRFTVDDHKAQRYLLGGVEQLIMKHEKVLLPKAAHILKKLYDLDICEEEAILAWGDKPSSKYVGKTAAKKIIDQCTAVLTWLREAEESESEEDEDDEINFAEDAKKSSMKEKLEAAEARRAMEKIKVEDGEELDIDDI